MAAPTRTSIDSILLKGTGLSEKELGSLFSTTTASGETIGQVMREESFSSADQAIGKLSELIGVDFVEDIPWGEISGDMVRNLPINYAKNFEVLPYKELAGELKVFVSNPLNFQVLDDLRAIFSKSVQPIMASSPKIQEAINKVYEKSTSGLDGFDEVEGEEYDLEDPVIDLLDAGEDDAPVIKLVNSLLFRAVKEKASDIHIEPFEKDMMVRFRIDGVLFDIFRPPKKLQNAITSRIKVMANLNIAEKRLPQDGRIPLKLAGKDIDVRLSTVPTAFGERIVMRLQDRSNVILDLDQLGFSKPSLIKIDEVMKKTYGILLVTGPTGSGKSTTLYSCLSKINTVDRNIVTVENPVEQRIHGIGQIQTNEKIGLTFASALRAILRQDPNVVMIGEIRDLETAEIAINASLTGHLVLSTIHTNDSPGVFPRLIDMGCEPFLIATSLVGVIAQRLVRVLCAHCKESYTPTEVELKALDLTIEQVQNANIYKPVGCNECAQKGYAGRTLIQEFLEMDDELRSLIMRRADGSQIKKAAEKNGMVSFRDHGIQKVLDGITSIEEVLTNTQVDA